MMEGPGADSEEKHEPVSDIDTAVVVVGLKALDPEWPIREAIGDTADIGWPAAGWTRFAVGTVVTDRPPHRTARAEFPHAAPTLGV